MNGMNNMSACYLIRANNNYNLILVRKLVYVGINSRGARRNLFFASY